MAIPDILKSVTENTKYIYQLKLRKTNLELVAFVPFISINFTKRYKDYNELSFEIADQIYISHIHSLVENPVWSKIKAGMIIELIIFSNGEKTFNEYYSIQQPNEQGGENEHRKTFQCIPLHQLEFNKKKLRGFDDTRKLFDFDLQYYTREGADKKLDLRPYAFKNETGLATEGAYTTYNPKMYTCGGILNYIIEYILNKETKIDAADIEEENLLTIDPDNPPEPPLPEEITEYNKTYYYPNGELPKKKDDGTLIDYDYLAKQSYHRLNLGGKGLLTDKKYWKVSYYDTDLLKIWSEGLGIKEVDYNAASLYDFFYGDIKIGYTLRSNLRDDSITSLSPSEATDKSEVVPYLKNGLMTYWNCYQRSGKGKGGINLKNGTGTDNSNKDWAKDKDEATTEISNWMTFGNWNEAPSVGMITPVVGRDAFAGGQWRRLEDYTTYVPSEQNSMQEVEKQSRLFYDIWSIDGNSHSSIDYQDKSYINNGDKKLLDSWGVSNWDPIYGGNLTSLLDDLYKPDSSNWYYAVLTDPLAGSLLTQRANACLTQLQNYIDVVMTATSATNILKTRKSPNTGEETTKEINGFDSEAFKNMYEYLTAFYQRVVYFLWFPLYQKFSSYTGKMPYRSLKIDNQNLTEVFKTLEEEFMCTFEFDNVNKEIKIYAQNNEKYNQDSQLILSPYNYITDMNVTRNTDQIVTRLYMEGKDGLWFTGVNPSGQRYIDDFTYYKNTDYMSNNLLSKLNLYDSFLNRFNLKDSETLIDFYYSIITEVGTGEETPPIVKEIHFSAEYPIFYLHWKEVMKDYSEASSLYAQLTKLETDYDAVETNMLSGLHPGDEGYLAAVSAKEAAQIGIYNSAAAIAHELSAYLGKLISDKGQIDWRGYKEKFPVFEKKVETFSKAMDSIKAGLTYQGVVINNDSELMLSYANHSFNDEGKEVYSFDFGIDITVEDNQIKISQRTVPAYSETVTPLFGEEELSELRNFIFEEDITQSSISNETTLLEYGQDYLKLLRAIPIETTINLVDILSVPSYYQDWKRLNDVGKKCRILYPKLGFYMDSDTMLTLTEYTHSYSVDSQNLSLKLSNSNDITSLQYKLQVNTWVSAFKAYKTIDKYQASWDDYINNKNMILWQNQNIRASTSPIVDAMGSRVVDGTGIVLSKANGNQIVKYADGLYCGVGIDGGAGNNEVFISLSDFIEETDSDELLKTFLSNLKENTIVFIYDDTEGKEYKPGDLKGGS